MKTNRFFRTCGRQSRTIAALLVIGSCFGVAGQDSLKIVVRDSVQIQNLLMRSDQDTLLQVLGKRSTDGAWVPVSADWAYIATLGGTSAAARSSWRFSPGDTGSGKIVVSMGTSMPDTIIVKILPALPRSVVLYNSELPPGPTVVKLPDPSQMIKLSAGTPFLLVVKVFDWRGVWLSQYQQSSLQNLITWSAFDQAGSLNNRLDNLTGAATRFAAIKTFDTVTIIATFRPDGSSMVMDTVRFVVPPVGVANRWVIETGPINLIQSNGLDTLYISANEQSKSVYAIIRDPFDNFVRYANISQWVSLDTTIVTVRKGDSLFGEGIVTRNPAALGSTTKVYAVDASSGARDTFIVKLECPCFYYRLRIMTGNTVAPDTLVMDLNQDTTLSVQVWRSTDSVWIDVSATWQNSVNLKIDPPAPIGNSWRFTPTDTGSGWIRVTLNNDGISRPDSVFVIFTKGPSAISGNPPFIRPDRYSITASAGATHIHIPLRGTHLITAYSLAGSVVSSIRTNANDARIRLPRGVFIVTVKTIGSAERFTTRIFCQ